MIEVKKIAFSYEKHVVLRDISFDANPGDCVAILGNNGVGKSTLVTCMNRIRKPSGGEAQKVMLARAFVQQPRLLLLDEPTSNLDPRNQYDMMKLVRHMAKEHGITVLVVIHDLNLALRYCNRFLFIKDGEVYGYGDESVVTEQALRDVYGINATLITYDNKKFSMIE